jgi:hypothetical protein
MELLGGVGHVESRFGPFRDSVVSVVCTKRTVGSKIILDAPDGTLGDIGHVKSRFDPFGDVLVTMQVGCTVCAKRTIDSENRFGRT